MNQAIPDDQRRPAILPGERYNAAVVTYLRFGRAVGMTIPDVADLGLTTFPVTASTSKV